ncbi:c-type cytochrome [Sulfurimonas sp. HSL-1656]|uniref:c-type cytochrome n=1 Tax=Thiomicrolovo subterrani TaxID=3131934 RepID=UPI0031F97E6F
MHCSGLKHGAAFAVSILVLGAWPLAAEGGKADIERGRYVATMMGCNDCHTPNYIMAEGKVPEALWLTGSPFGWRGPWGTTYATNLRMRLAGMTEDEWVAKAKQLKARPPMPWFNLNQMKEEDMRAFYRYVRHLGAAGAEAPAYVPPNEEPNPPYATFPSPPPAK